MEQEPIRIGVENSEEIFEEFNKEIQRWGNDPAAITVEFTENNATHPKGSINKFIVLESG